MAISFDSALGIHEKAMEVRIKRSEVLANNLANADTPNFKARDIDFRSVLQNQTGLQMTQPAMRATHERHLSTSASLSPSVELMYRNPLQPSLDGNTVEEQSEMSRFSKNSLDFQASFQFLNAKFAGLKNALKGGN